jgi:hypothetical protein
MLGTALLLRPHVHHHILSTIYNNLLSICRILLCLGREHESRILVTHGENLLLGLALHLVIPFSKTPLLVLPYEVEMEECKHTSANRDKRKIGSMT